MQPQKQGRNRHGRFKPGVSGNPGGRPAGRPSIAAALRGMAEQAAAFDFDAPKGETWAERIARVIIERAAAGDLRAAAIVIERIDGRGAAPTPNDDVVTIEEL
jgi:hypothetical protein